MRNAPFGHISLNNDFKLHNNILVGITHDTKFSVEGFLKQFSDIKSVEFEAVLIENIMAFREAVVPELGDDWFEAHPDPELEAIVDDFRKKFESKKLKFGVCAPCSAEPDYLRDRSILYDLFAVGEEVMMDENAILFEYFYDLKCPILVQPHKYSSPDHIIFLFDGTAESLLGVKKFIKMFSDNILNSTVTAMILNDQVSKSFNEKIIVDFLLSNFIDVGVVFTTVHALDRDLNRMVKHYPKSILLTGLNGTRALVSQNVRKLIVDNSIPLFFSS